MNLPKVINAAEAKKIVLDQRREALDLAEEALFQVLRELNENVHKAVKLGDWETAMNLSPITRLTSVNIQASKTAVSVLGYRLRELGYKTEAFTNHTHMVTVRWD